MSREPQTPRRGRAPADARPELEIPDIRRQRPELPVTCGACLYLHRYATYPLPCDQYGTISSSTPCNRFKPDPSQLGEARDVRDALQAIGRSGSALLLTAILAQSRQTRRLGFRVGEVVYFRVLGGDYLCNYAFGVVTGAERDLVIIMGAHGFVARISASEVMGRDAWETHCELLKKRDRINDPKGGLRKIAVRGRSRLVQYEPPEARLARKPRGPRSTFSGRRKTGTIVLSSGDAR